MSERIHKSKFYNVDDSYRWSGRASSLWGWTQTGWMYSGGMGYGGGWEECHSAGWSGVWARCMCGLEGQAAPGVEWESSIFVGMDTARMDVLSGGGGRGGAHLTVKVWVGRWDC